MEIKTCPFCGGEASVERNEIPGDYMVACRGCLIGVIHSEREVSKDVVAELWNKRVDLKPSPAIMDCGCVIDQVDLGQFVIGFCPLHMNAPRMLSHIKGSVDWIDACNGGGRACYLEAEEIIEAVEKKGLPSPEKTR